MSIPATSSKDAPAFDFYAERWSHGTRHLSKVERCDYLDLLIFQWTEQGIPGDLDTLARILGYRRGSQVPSAVLEKFPLCDDGRRRNTRLESIRQDQRTRINTRKIGAAIAHAKVNGVASLSDEERLLLEAAGKLVNGLLVTGRQVASNGASKVAEGVASSLPPPTTHHPPHISERESPRGRPTVEAAKAQAGTVGVTEREAEDWWNAREASDWMKGTGGGGTTPVGTNWQADMKTFTNAMREQRAREANRNHATTTPHRRSSGQLNRPGRYA